MYYRAPPPPPPLGAKQVSTTDAQALRAVFEVLAKKLDTRNAFAQARSWMQKQLVNRSLSPGDWQSLNNSLVDTEARKNAMVASMLEGEGDRYTENLGGKLRVLRTVEDWSDAFAELSAYHRSVWQGQRDNYVDRIFGSTCSVDCINQQWQEYCDARSTDPQGCSDLSDVCEYHRGLLGYKGTCTPKEHGAPKHCKIDKANKRCTAS
jgi:hypothetical protein